jgi:hypothetical protein
MWVLTLIQPSDWDQRRPVALEAQAANDLLSIYFESVELPLATAHSARPYAWEAATYESLTLSLLAKVHHTNDAAQDLR